MRGGGGGGVPAGAHAAGVNERAAGVVHAEDQAAHLARCSLALGEAAGEEQVPDILDSAFAVLEYDSGARAMLDLCMFAENTVDKEHITVVGDEGKLESLLPSLTLRHGRREDWGRREAWGQSSGTGKGVSVRRVWDTNFLSSVLLRFDHEGAGAQGLAKRGVALGQPGCAIGGLGK